MMGIAKHKALEITGYSPKHFGPLLFLIFLFIFCGDLAAQDWKTLKPGVEYAEATKEISGQTVNMNLLRLDLTKVRLDVAHAMDAAIGTEKTSSIATRHGAFAAINAGFFRLDDSIFEGDAAGILKIDGQVLSESLNNRTAILISNFADRSDTYIGPVWLDERLSSKTINLVLSGLNRERKANETIRYSPEFARTTLTDNTGLEVTVRKGKITAVNDMSGGTAIPADGYVISASGAARDDLRPRVKVGDKIALLTGPTVDNGGHFLTEANAKYLAAFSTAEDITNGVPRLIKDGKIDITWEQEKTNQSFVETRHPRTAVAKLSDGKFLMITVDGRSESSGGISLYDLADHLLSLGAVDAMNLDGGGSTTMFVDGKVVNHPSDKDGERKVSDAILVTLRNK